MLNLLERRCFPLQGWLGGGVKRQSPNEGSLALFQKDNLQVNLRNTLETSPEKPGHHLDPGISYVIG